MATNQKKYGHVRVTGSGFTQFTWNGQVILMANAIEIGSPAPVAQPVAIQPLDARYPIEIVTPAALGPGTLRVETFELYNSRVWDQMMRIVDKSGGVYNDLVEIFIKLSALKNPIHAVKKITPPSTLGGSEDVAARSAGIYGDMYHNCKITDIGDNERVEISSMQVTKAITIMYTKKTRLSGSATNK